MKLTHPFSGPIHTDWSESKGEERRTAVQPDLVHLRSLPSFDTDYRFGRPTLYLTPRDLARLVLVRSTLGETRAEREAELLTTHGPRRSIQPAA